MAPLKFQPRGGSPALLEPKDGAPPEGGPSTGVAIPYEAATQRWIHRADRCRWGRRPASQAVTRFRLIPIANRA